MRRVNRCLNKQLIDLYQHSIQLDELNLKLTHFLPSPLRENCSVGSFNRGCLLIVTNNASWATELRYIQPMLRDRLRTEAGLYQLISIKVQIEVSIPPLSPTKINKLNGPHLSCQARDIIRNAGESCSYQPLKDILIHLADKKD